MDKYEKFDDWWGEQPYAKSDLLFKLQLKDAYLQGRKDAKEEDNGT